ncbi:MULTISPECIES: LysM peptidoglycan-binding domain-containing protein [unclassified Curtobacterium]|uniref:LysM peptidoglycan-binding domain-containing protein n=1 Tax=unclassified Curtobacterium TaxID=257496 RepID=UPI003807E0D4
MHRGIVVGLVAVVAVGLTGCSLLRGDTGGVPAPSRTPSASASATPSASATTPGQSDAELLQESASPRPPTAEPTQASLPAPTITAIPAGTVVAQGDVASPKGSIHFHYRVVAGSNDRFVVEYSGFTSTLPVPVSATFLEDAPQVGDGLTHLGPGDDQLGGPTTSAPAAVAVPMDSAGYDPSWLGALVTYSSATTDDASLPIEIANGKVLAVNPVRWSVPARTTNVHPVDHGAAANASGSVSAKSAAGAPASYVVAPDDLIADVAARFGISVETLIWLNPSMRVYGNLQYLYEGTTLNLDPVRR